MGCWTHTFWLLNSSSFCFPERWGTRLLKTESLVVFFQLKVWCKKRLSFHLTPWIPLFRPKKVFHTYNTFFHPCNPCSRGFVSLLKGLFQGHKECWVLLFSVLVQTNRSTWPSFVVLVVNHLLLRRKGSWFFVLFRGEEERKRGSLEPGTKNHFKGVCCS